MVSRAALALSAASCAAVAHPQTAAPGGDQVVLYRDRAIVTQRVEVTVAANTATTVQVAVAAGTRLADLAITDRGGLEILALQTPDTATRPTDPDADGDALDNRSPARAPLTVELVVRAPRAGHYALSLGYLTEQLAWDVAYTLTTSAARDRAVLRGAVAIHNTSGIALHAHTYLVDTDLGSARERSAQQLSGAPSEPPATSRDLGVLALPDGEIRAELVRAEPQPMRSVLVYDPIGTALDHPGSVPISDPAVGVVPAPPSRITESFEIDRDPRASAGLPTGPVRLLQQQIDGALALLGQSALFDAATRVANVDTVAIGTADAVTGHRERRDWSHDNDRRRFSEEVLVTIDNARSHPIDVVIREHLYRGQNWTLAYQSAPAVKEGPQQIALRTQVPANGQAKVLYVVVYTW